LDNLTKLDKAPSSTSSDYKKLYFTAINKLTDLSEAIVNAQQELEELYLNQTEPDEPTDN